MTRPTWSTKRREFSARVRNVGGARKHEAELVSTKVRNVGGAWEHEVELVSTKVRNVREGANGSCEAAVAFSRRKEFLYGQNKDHPDGRVAFS